jgi:MFS transporter, ACS family, tartrate transporter
VTLEERAFRKATRRLIPFLFLIYVVAYLDRVNVSFAQLQLEDDLGFSDTIFGLGAGIFSLGYVIFGVPSNLALARFGARRWLAAIMIAWGVISASMMFIGGPGSFYLLRFLLGAAEAGFFPGIILFLTWWFPERERTRALALFFTAVSVAYVFGGPVSGGLLELDSFAGLDGWQWLFLIEGLPAVVLGFVVLRYLTDRPEDAFWLAPDERAWLSQTMARERAHDASPHTTLRGGLLDRAVWRLSATFFLLVVSGYGFSFWLPQIVKGLSGASDQGVGRLTALPYIVAAIGMVTVAAHSDRTGERRWHVALAAFTASAGFLLAALATHPLGTFLGLCVVALGAYSATPPFWSLPTGFLRGTAAAAGIAFINSVGNLGGFVGPYLMGWMKELTGGFQGGLMVLAVAPLLAGLSAITLRKNGSPPRDP